MTLRAAPLFDAERLRALRTPGLGALTRSTTTVVLGSRQPVEDLDESALRRDGVAVRRRRGGGGAVLLAPEDCWIEVWLPASDGPVFGDLRATAYGVGERWRTAFSSIGVSCELHRGAVDRADEGAVACFAGIGPGELSVEGRKVLGLSQWRAREGVLVSSVVPCGLPSTLFDYLSATAPPAASLSGATGLSSVAPASSASLLAERFCRAVSDALPAVAALHLDLD